MRSLLEVESRDQVEWESRLVTWTGLEFLRKTGGLDLFRKGLKWSGQSCYDYNIKVGDSSIFNQQISIG